MADLPAFEAIYSEVMDKQGAELQKFRQAHPPQRVVVAETEWEYLDSGAGDEIILLLVGGLRMADAAYRNIPMLDDDFRVITPSYPALNTMSALADGLAAILDHEGISAAHVLAGSFGGMLAQVFIRRHPQKVSKLILSTTAVLDDDSAARYRQLMAMLEPMDQATVTQVAQEQMFNIIAPPESDHAFYRAYLNELYTYRVDKQALLSTYRSLLDFADNWKLSPDDLADWQGDMLILESDDDATFDESVRSRVRGLYPFAQTHVFHGAGHSPGTTQRDKYFEVVKSFLHGD
jgi:pimeloyl-ACP methyl ester carboxylesterase